MREPVTFSITIDDIPADPQGFALVDAIKEVLREHDGVKLAGETVASRDQAQTAREKAPPAKAAPAKASGGAQAKEPVKGGNSKSKPKAKPASDPLDLSDVSGGDDEDEDNDPGGLGLADDADENNDVTPAEAHATAIDKLRHMAQTGAYKAEFKQLQQKLKVARLIDVPVESGHEFLKLVNAIEANKA